MGTDYIYMIMDHEALKKLMAVKEPTTPKLAQYVELMSTYGIMNDRILYRPSLKNQAPDALSRHALLLDPGEVGLDLEDDKIPSCHYLQGGGDKTVTQTQVHEGTDDAMGHLTQWSCVAMIQNRSQKMQQGTQNS